MSANRRRWGLPLILFVIGALLGAGGAATALHPSVSDRPATAAPVPVPTPVPPKPKPIPLTVVTWNVCGNATSHCPASDHHDLLTAAIVQVARTQQADVLLLQEMCSHMLPGLKLGLGAGWTVHFRQAAIASVLRGAQVTAPATCEAKRGLYGQAVALRPLRATGDTGDTSGGQPWLVHLPSPKATGKVRMEQRLAVCVRLRSPHLQVCGAHLSSQDPGGGIRAAQVARLADEARKGRQLGYETIVGGDLNTPASAASGRRNPILESLYKDNVECDPTNAQATFRDLKIDYLFSGPGLVPLGCEAIPTELSDHAILTARYHLDPAVHGA